MRILIKGCLLVLLACACGAVSGAESPSSYSETLKNFVGRAVMNRVGHLVLPEGLIQGGRWSVILTPLPGLDTPDAVPYLIDVLKNGPGWTDERIVSLYDGRLPYIARCVAAANLGALKDPRVYEPLVDVLLHEGPSPWHDPSAKLPAHDVRAYAGAALTYLGDERAIPVFLGILRNSTEKNMRSGAVGALGQLHADEAVDDLMSIMTDSSENRDIRGACMRSLALIHDLRTIPAVLETAGETDYPIIDSIMKRMTGVYIHTGEKEVLVLEFPELAGQGPFDDLSVWRHWYAVGERWTKERFEDAYAELERVRRERPELEGLSSIVEVRIDNLGRPALPLIMEKIREGDTDLLYFVRRHSRWKVSEEEGAAEALSWWEANKAKMNVFGYAGEAPVEPVMPETPEP